MDFENRSNAQYATNLPKLKYKPMPCTTFEIAIFPDNAHPIYFAESTKDDTEILQWIRSSLPKSNDKDDPKYCLRLIVGPRVSERSTIGLLSIPFEETTFKEIIAKFRLPKTLLQAILDKKLHFSNTPHPDKDSTSWKGFVLRTEPDYLGRNDIALSLAFQPTTGLTTALLLGCSNDPRTFQDSEIIKPFLSFPQSSIGQPKLLLALISILQLERYIKQDDDIDGRIEEALYEVGLNRTEGPATRSSAKGNAKTDPKNNIDYNEVTKDVLQLFTEAGYLMQAMMQFSKLLDGVLSTLEIADMPAERMEYHKEHTNYIKAHIEATKDNILRMADNNRLAAERVSSLLSSIWNLIAQKESQESRSIAEQSKTLAASSKEIAEDAKRIAAATRRDSTSMKAIAALTMVFLPSTFVASLFAMPVFNWQAGPDQKVLSANTLRYFQYYWAAATPLTACVLGAWIGWIWWSYHKQKKEDAKLATERTVEQDRANKMVNTGFLSGQAGQTSTMKVVRTSTFVVAQTSINASKTPAANVAQIPAQSVPFQDNNIKTTTNIPRAPHIPAIQAIPTPAIAPPQFFHTSAQPF